jgi:hypothetical protein
MTASDRLNKIQDLYPYGDVRPVFTALRAVLDLHQPDEFSDPPICGCCSYIPTEDEEHYFEAVALYTDYPCPTVEAVNSALNN